jgi:hypothetical protein
VCATHCHRILIIKADNQARTTAPPDTQGLIKIPADVRADVSQVGSPLIDT